MTTGFSNCNAMERVERVYNLASRDPEPKIQLLQDVEDFFARHGCTIRWGPDFKPAADVATEQGTFWRDFVRRKWTDELLTVKDLLQHVTIQSRFSLRTPDKFYDNVVTLAMAEMVFADPDLTELLRVPIGHVFTHKLERPAPSTSVPIAPIEVLEPVAVVDATEDWSGCAAADKPIFGVDPLPNPVVDFAALQDLLDRRTRIRSNALRVAGLMREAENAAGGQLRFFEEAIVNLILESAFSVRVLPDRFECLAEVVVVDSPVAENWTPALLLSRVAERPWSGNGTLAGHLITPAYVAGLVQANPGLVSDNWQDGLKYLSPAQLHHDFETTRSATDSGLVSELISRTLSSELRERLLDYLLQ